MTIKSTLIAARELLSDPAHWTQGAAKRIEVDKPTCYCVLGAIEHAAGRSDKAYYAASKFVNDAVLYETGGLCDLIDFNDDTGRTHAAVLAMLDRVIARAP